MRVSVLAALLVASSTLGCFKSYHIQSAPDPVVEERMAALKAANAGAPAESISDAERFARLERQMEAMQATLELIAAAQLPPATNAAPAAPAASAAPPAEAAPPAAEPAVPAAPEVAATPSAPAVPVNLISPSAEFQFDNWSNGEQRTIEKLTSKFGAGTEKEEVSNREDLVGKPLTARRFLGPNGDILDLNDFKGSKNVVLVVLRGFSGQVCIGCSSYTLALANAQEEFEARDTQVLLVYPGSGASIPAFLESIRKAGGEKQLPYPVLLDLDLNAVQVLDIRGSLAKPTSLIVDKQGTVRFAYTGKRFDDRPSVKALLDEIDGFGK